MQGFPRLAFGDEIRTHLYAAYDTYLFKRDTQIYTDAGCFTPDQHPTQFGGGDPYFYPIFNFPCISTA